MGLVLGLLLIAMFAGAAVSAVMVVWSQPVWLVILAYPVTGTLVLLLVLLVAGIVRRSRAGSSENIHWPVPRSTAPKVAIKTLRSVTSETLRS